jgi:hypothetical protein
MLESEPLSMADFCPTCGAKTITACQRCNAPIPAQTFQIYTRPAFCTKCAVPYPWTESAIKASDDLARLEMAEADRNELADIIENLVADTPQTVVAASRFRRLMGKVTPVVAEGFKAIMINVATEAAKKAMFPGK